MACVRKSFPLIFGASVVEVKSSADSASNDIEKAANGNSARAGSKAIRVAHVRRKCGRGQCGTQEVYFVSLRSTSSHATLERAKGYGSGEERGVAKDSHPHVAWTSTAFGWRCDNVEWQVDALNRWFLCNGQGSFWFSFRTCCSSLTMRMLVPLSRGFGCCSFRWSDCWALCPETRPFLVERRASFGKVQRSKV